MGDRSLEKTILVLITLSIVGGILKVYGSIVGGSKSVFVDAMTSIANTLAIILILKFFRAGMEPPDTDHHYGHHRLALGGPISMLMLYSFVAGIIILDIVSSIGKSYEVSYKSPLYASIAMIPYGLSVAIAKRSHSIVSSYGGFTVIELIESLVSIASSLGGIMVNYVIDFVGAIALMAYLLFELTENFREIVEAVSDVAPKEVINKIQEIAKNHEVEISRVRVRRIIEKIYHGDVIVEVNPSIPLEKAHEIADSIEKELKKQGMDVIVHVEPSNNSKKRNELSSS
ncbi:MAG: cation transporter dimerization domain-containing protein [Ignisphaera sp.]